MIGGVNTKVAKLPPVPAYPARVTNRADEIVPRVRFKLSRDADIEKINALPGVVLLVEIDEPDLLEVMSAEVYAVHPGGLIDCYLRGKPFTHSDKVVLRRTSLGKVP